MLSLFFGAGVSHTSSSSLPPSILIDFSTCVLTVLRVLAIFHGTADFTWSNVPVAAYYVYEPVGGLLCINIPFIARAIHRKVKAHQTGDASDSSLPYDKPPQPEQLRRHSRWLHGIDSIHLTGMSSPTRSRAHDLDAEQRPWAPITALTTTTMSSTIDLPPQNLNQASQDEVHRHGSSFDFGFDETHGDLNI